MWFNQKELCIFFFIVVVFVLVKVREEKRNEYDWKVSGFKKSGELNFVVIIVEVEMYDQRIFIVFYGQNDIVYDYKSFCYFCFFD